MKVVLSQPMLLNLNSETVNRFGELKRQQMLSKLVFLYFKIDSTHVKL